MSNILQFKPLSENYDTACDWLAKIDRNLSDEEVKVLETWLQEDKKNRETLIEVAVLWDKMHSLSRLSSLFPMSGLEEVSQKEFQVANKHWFLPLAVSAAAVLLVFLTVYFGSVSFYFNGDQAPLDIVDSGGALYKTSVGERNTLDLSDGSRVILNTNTRLRVRYSESARLLILERGEIHVDVAHDEDRPLSVYAASKLVQAVGTAFNIQVFSEEALELTVTDGTVVVSSSVGHSVEKERLSTGLSVTKGERVLLSQNNLSESKVSQVKEYDIEADLSWRKGNLVFRGETLAFAVSEVERYTHTKFEIIDANLKDLKIAGLFKAGDVQGLLATLSDNFHIDHRFRKDGTVVLTYGETIQD